MLPPVRVAESKCTIAGNLRWAKGAHFLSFLHGCRNSRWNVAVRMQGSGEGLLPGRLRPGMAEREATGMYSRRSWKQALPRAPGTIADSIVRADSGKIACKQAPTGAGTWADTGADT